ncbi:hypothetical protein K2Y00_03605 [Patescibacteria group bacterium]|nr:hypothetical protein [Patescibacteria group bacterium]
MGKQRVDPHVEKGFALLLVVMVSLAIGYLISQAMTHNKFERSEQTVEEKIKESDKE